MPNSRTNGDVAQSNSVGRPVSVAPRNDRISMRVTRDEKELINYWMTKNEQTLTEFIMESVETHIKWMNSDYDLPRAEIARLNQIIDALTNMGSRMESLEGTVTSGFESMIGLVRGDNYLLDETERSDD